MNNFKVKAMKKTIILLLILLMLPFHRTVAQNPNLEKLNNYKIGFFTKKLNFTPGEAEKFWPVYNEYQDKKALIQQEKSSLMKSFNQNEKTMSVSQLTELADKMMKHVT